MRFYRQGWRLLPGLVTVILVAGLAKLSVFKPYEQSAYRFAFQLRGERTWSEDVAVIAIDDYSIAKLGRFPWPRDYYAELLTILDTAEPRVVAFNVLFSEPTLEDGALALAMQDVGQVVLAEAWDATGELLALPGGLQQAALETGHIDQNEQDSDGLVRSIQPLRRGRLALPWMAVDMAKPSFEKQLSQNPSRTFWINWPGSARGLSTYSFADVMQDQVDKSVFHQKVVLVGVSATGIDALRTPFDLETPTSNLILHAAVVDNLLLNRPLKPLNGIWVWGGLILGALGLSWCLVSVRSRNQFLIILALGASWCGVFSGLFFMDYWLPLAKPLALIGMTGSTSVIYRNLRENRLLQQHINRLWQNYQADLVLPSVQVSPQTETITAAEPISPSMQRLTVLAESFGRSQSTQAAIARNLSLGLLAADTQGTIWFCNPVAKHWLQVTTGASLLDSLIPTWITTDEWQADLAVLTRDRQPVHREICRGDRWFELTLEQLTYSVADLRNPGSTLREGWVLLLEDITHRKQIETQLRDLNQTLETQVQHRTAELESANADLRREISSRRQAQEQLAYRAFHDELTGLPNRSQFIYQLRKTLDQAKQDTNYQFAVLFLDFNRFKLINDSFGHLVGDQLLKAFANRLQSSLRPRDWIARFGGDEFMLLLRKIESRETAIVVANRILEHLVTPFHIGTQQIFVSTSIGIVVADQNYQRADDILRDADTAMYQAKHQGLPFEIFEGGMHLAVRSSLQMETELRIALEQQELEVYYQPIVDINNNSQPIGFEALLRWHHPERGLILPGKFIPVAEETGLILPMGQWVLQQACQQMKTWQKQRLVTEQTLISVNLSGKQFSQPNLLEQIETVLAETQLAEHCLKLEITESAIMTNTKFAIETLKQLRDRQIKLSIDDFGTGYSSLSYLQSLPVNILKIHRSFIYRLTQDRRKLGIVQAIATLARTLDICIIAEGIETPEQLKQLKSLGCEFGQGYLFSHPLDHYQIEAWLEEQKAGEP
ncbi:MAG: EAL domain-containing protein, partial [Cyanobacteria bacterium J06642_9]